MFGPVQGDFYACPTVSILLLLRGPTAILRRVPGLVIDPLNRCVREVGRTHIVIKILKGLPPLTDTDSASAVSFPALIATVLTASFHREPNVRDHVMGVGFVSGNTQEGAREKPASVRINFHTNFLQIAVVALIFMAIVSPRAAARDDGRYANSVLKPWFDQLKSKKGPCCSDADGFAVSDPDWDSRNGHYRVRLKGVWIDVPDDAVITEPNRAGMTMVWPIYLDGVAIIRCFMPGSMT